MGSLKSDAGGPKPLGNIMCCGGGIPPPGLAAMVGLSGPCRYSWKFSGLTKENIAHDIDLFWIKNVGICQDVNYKL